MYLSQDSLSCEIVSAKSSEMNVLVPGKDGEFVSDWVNYMRNAEEIQMRKMTVLEFYCFCVRFISPDWDPCPWAIQNRLGRQKAGHYSHRDCRIKTSSMILHPLCQCLPDWLTNQPITNKTEMVILSTLPISQSEAWLNILSANEMAVCFYAA